MAFGLFCLTAIVNAEENKNRKLEMNYLITIEAMDVITEFASGSN